MSNLVIVAIPEENDRVWKISSEQVPHLTLLFLGDADNNPHTEQIVQFVEHAVTLSEHGQFYLDVDHRGILGDAEADVLFFSNRSWNLRWIKQFRGQLLQNQQIRSAYDSTPQHTAPQDWVPHLTLGYPETPAKADPNDEPFGHPLYSVAFDRIAVWTGDFDGPEFRLEWPDREMEGDLAVAYSDQQKKALTHFGVKGMRWGQKKTETVTVGGKTKQVTPKKAAKLDKKFEKKSNSLDTYIKVHNGSADHFNKHIGDLNKKYPMDLTKHENRAHADAYNREVEDLARAAYQDSASKIKNPTGTRSIDVQFRDDGSLLLGTKAVQHTATGGDETFVFKVLRDAKGLITSIEPEQNGDNTMAQSALRTTTMGEAFVGGMLKHQSVLDNPTLAEQIKAKVQSILDDVTGDADTDLALFGDPLVRTKIQSVLEDFYKDPNVDDRVVYDALGESFVEHYGIKGMQWGRRKSPPDAVSPTASSVVPHGSRRKTKVSVKGGENHPASEDALKVEEARAKLKRSGPKALSNKELRDVADRLRLEEQATTLDRSTSRLTEGRKFIKKLTGIGKEANDTVNTGFQTAELARKLRAA